MKQYIIINLKTNEKVAIIGEDWLKLTKERLFLKGLYENIDYIITEVK